MNSVDIDSGPDDIYSAAIILCLLAPYRPTAEVHGLCHVVAAASLAGRFARWPLLLLLSTSKIRAGLFLGTKRKWQN